MTTTRKTLAEAKAKPFAFSTKAKARLAALSDAEIEQTAASDSDNPALGDDILAAAVLGRRVRLARKRLGLSQSRFAERFRIPVATLRDWEQGRHKPDATALAYLTVIERAPDAVERALKE